MDVLDTRPENEIIPTKYYPTYLQSLGLIGIWLVATFCVVIVLMPFTDVKSGIGLFLSYTLSMSVTVLAGLALRKNYTLELTGFSTGIALIASLLVIPLHIALDPLVSLFPVPDTLKTIFEDLYNNPIASVATIAIAAPLLEELLLRGIILEGLLKNYRPGISIAFSSLLFAIIHGNLAQGLGAFVLGLFMGWIYWKTKSLALPILLHFINNGLSCLAMFIVPKEAVDKKLIDWVANDQLYYGLVFTSIIFCVAVVMLLQKKYFDKPDH